MKRLLILAALAIAACSDPQPDVVFETELGDVVIEVNPDAAPFSSADFLRYVDEGYYDGQGFYRSVTAATDPQAMGMSLVQGGRLGLEPLGDMVAHERTDMTGLSNVEGTVSLARNEPGTGSAAFFFINLGDNRFLDSGDGTRNPDGEGYAVFGRVTKGMDVLREIQSKPTAPDEDGVFSDGQKLAEPVYIMRAYRR